MINRNEKKIEQNFKVYSMIRNQAYLHFPPLLMQLLWDSNTRTEKKKIRNSSI